MHYKLVQHKFGQQSRHHLLEISQLKARVRLNTTQPQNVTVGTGGKIKD